MLLLWLLPWSGLRFGVWSMSVHHDGPGRGDHLPPSVARSRSPRTGSSPMSGRRRSSTAPQAPASASGGRIVDDVGRQQLGRDGGRGAEPRQLASDRVGERGAGAGDAAADDDELDVVGHDEQVDRPGEPAARRVDEVGGDGVAGGRGREDVGLARRATVRPRRAIAGPEAIVSKQPCRPQAQRAPSRSTMTWPISPAMPRTPRWSRAVEDDAGRDAGPDREVGEVVESPQDAALVEADGGGADVVLDDDREAERGLERGRAGSRASRG